MFLQRLFCTYTGVSSIMYILLFVELFFITVSYPSQFVPVRSGPCGFWHPETETGISWLKGNPAMWLNCDHCGHVFKKQRGFLIESAKSDFTYCRGFWENSAYKDYLPASHTWWQIMPPLHVIIKYQQKSQLKLSLLNLTYNFNAKAYQIVIKRWAMPTSNPMVHIYVLFCMYVCSYEISNK